MATNVELALEEVNAAIDAIEPPLEGLRDFDRLNIHPDTKAIVQEQIAVFDRRFQLLQGAKNALEAIINDGYPLIPVREIPASAFEDLRENQTTIQAAFAQFSEATAAALGLSSAPAQPK
jgi:hypothetical protein